MSFFQIDPKSDFSLHNIPFGVYSQSDNIQQCATRLGDYVVNLGALELQGLFNGPLLSQLKTKVFHDEKVLNKFMSLGQEYVSEVRKTIQELFNQKNEKLEQNSIKINEVKMHLPCTIGDYTDFYSSYNHAYNVGCLIRGPANAIQENWKHLPVGYHGRSSSIILSGQDVTRPRGQIKGPNDSNPSFQEIKRMDFELEMGMFLGGRQGKINQQGYPIKVNEANQYIFGYVLVNDWSARDVQTWEYVPLGPFNAKNFATSISPWIVTFEALEPFKVQLEKQDPEPLKYLQENDHSSYDINLEVYLNRGEKEEKITESNFKFMYWSPNQQLAHHSITGCNMNVGDLLASGTISGPTEKSLGCMLEMCKAGKEPITLSDGTKRTFLENGDSVVMKGFAVKNGIRVGFGLCEGKVLPALDESNYF